MKFELPPGEGEIAGRLIVSGSFNLRDRGRDRGIAIDGWFC